MSKIVKDHLLAPQKWKGYTIDELRYRQALTAVAIEVEKDRLAAQAGRYIPGVGGSKLTTGSVLSKIWGALSYVDYAVIAFTVLRKFMGFRRKLKS
ncbi:MAG: hypothetical protein LUC85_07830 [Bacteroidales bacterium]|nr:hypothetical protein [Bacteroidales bacterium]MCD8394724.1 hypothetical protein [Bacteroidales bacterium]